MADLMQRSAKTRQNPGAGTKTTATAQQAVPAPTTTELPASDKRRGSADLTSDSADVTQLPPAETAANNPAKQYALAIDMRRIFTRMEMLGYGEYHQQTIRGRPISQLYFAADERSRHAPGGDPFMTFARLAAWLLRKCGRNSAEMPEPEETDDPNEISYNIVEQCKKLNLDTAASFKPYKLKTGYGEDVIKVLSALTERAMQVNVQLALPTYPTLTNDDAGGDDETIEEIRTGALLGGDDAGADARESSDEEDDGVNALGDYVVANARAGVGGINSSSDGVIVQQQQPTGGANFTVAAELNREAQTLADMQMPAITDDDWRAEVERVQHRLKVVIRPDNRDWRSHIEQLTTLTKEINTLGKDTSEQLGKLAGEIGKTYDKLTSREKYVNKQLSELTGKFRTSRQQLRDLRDRGRDGRRGIEEKLEKINRYDEQLDEIKRKIEDKTTEMTDRNSITTLKVAMKRLKEEINLMNIRTAVIDQVILRNRSAMRNAVGNGGSLLTVAISNDNITLFDTTNIAQQQQQQQAVAM